MKLSRIALALFFLTFPVTFSAQEVVAPERGSIDVLKGLHRVFVICDDDDKLQTITRFLRGSKVALEIANSPKDADFFLELTDLERDVAATRSGGAIYKKSQMRAFIVRLNDKARVIAWTETETYERHTQFHLGAPNEINLVHHFINALEVARGEKKSSIGDLFKRGKRAEKELNKAGQ